MKRRIHNFEKLQAWQTASRIDKSVFLLTKNFPNREQFIIVSQIQRASISICSNIAEGSGRRIGKEQGQFYKIAYSSLLEVINQLLLAINREYLTEEEYIKIFENDIFVLKNQLRSLYRYTTSGQNAIPS